MGSTLTAWQTGSFSFNYVIAIEGYSYLLTDAAPSVAVTAWTGTDWTQALGGLTVDLQNKSEINPWAPFGGGGTCRLWIQPDTTDQFGIDSHKKSAGAETQLVSTIDRDDTTITVRDNTGFSASGELYIGTECIGYSSKPSSTTFAVSKRGRYAPFASGGASPVSFAQHHRVGNDSNMVQLDPVVSQQPRVWIGKWVGVWVHQQLRGSVLASKANAQLVFAGRIVSLYDDPNTGCTVVELENVQDVVKNATIGRSMFTGSLSDGVYLDTSTTTTVMKFSFRDRKADATNYRTATDLTIVASGASGANQINAGWYTHAQLCTALNQWLASELAASRVYGYYYFRSPTLQGDGSYRTTITYQMPTAVSPSFEPQFFFDLPTPAAILLGLEGSTDNSAGDTRYTVNAAADNNGTQFTFRSTKAPVRTVLSWKNQISNGHRVLITNTAGTFFDQTATLPQAISPIPTALQWGVFIIDGQLAVRASYDPATGYLTNILPLSIYFSQIGAGSTDGSGSSPFAKGFDDPSDIKITQVYMIECTLQKMLARIFYGTGTSAYNSVNYDDQVYGLGIGIPGELLGSTFENSIGNLPGANNQQLLVLDKPTKLVETIPGELVIRRASLIWKQGTLRFAQIVTPTTNASVATLGESTKALDVNSHDMGSQRAASVLTTDWQKVIVKLAYNRSITDLTGSGSYASNITIEDSTTVDDQGGAGDPYTIELRNTYSQFVGTGAGIEQLAPNFLATMPLFSRPISRLSRSIDLRYFEQLAPGDVVNVNDNFARDPATGTLSITTRPGVITKLAYTLGFASPGNSAKPSPMSGSIEVYFLDVNRSAAYCPTAQVDDTATTGTFTNGYSSSTLQLRCYAHQHSEASESADASYFNVNDVVNIVEIDPTSLSAPVKWNRTVTAVSANDITINSALASPAFDSTKKYRITADHYTDSTATQQANVFSASSTTGNVEATRAPYSYALSNNPGVTSYTGWALGELGEFLPDLAVTAGQARDTGNDRALIRLINAVNDYRTAHCSPMLWVEKFPSPAGGKTYQVCYYCPIFLGTELTGQAYRQLKVAPYFKSNSGSSISVRVSLMRQPLKDATLDDVDRGLLYSEAVFTTSSTTYQVPAEQSLYIGNVKNPSGVAYLLIEGMNGSATYGLAECIETYRLTA